MHGERAYGVGMIGAGLAEFMMTVLVPGVISGSAWYVMRK